MTERKNLGVSKSTEKYFYYTTQYRLNSSLSNCSEGWEGGHFAKPIQNNRYAKLTQLASRTWHGLIDYLFAY